MASFDAVYHNHTSQTLTVDPLKTAGLIFFVILVVIIWTSNHKWYEFHLGAPLGFGEKHFKRLVYIAFLVNSQLFCSWTFYSHLSISYNLTHIMFVQGSHAFAIFYTHALREYIRAHTYVMTFTQFAQKNTMYGVYFQYMFLLCMYLELD